MADLVALGLDIVNLKAISTAGDAGRGGKKVVEVIEIKPITTYGKGTEIASILADMPELTGSNRDKLLSVIQNSELWKIVDKLYRPGATFGDGGTAAILVEEFYAGSSKHLIKAQERLNALNKLASSGKLGLNDLDLLDALRNDLIYVINLFK